MPQLDAQEKTIPPVLPETQPGPNEGNELRSIHQGPYPENSTISDSFQNCRLQTRAN